MQVQHVVTAYAYVLSQALPICIVFHLANLMVGTFLRAAFGGQLVFRQ